MSRNWIIAIIVGIVVVLCCLGVACVALGGMAFFAIQEATPRAEWVTNTPYAVNPATKAPQATARPSKTPRPEKPTATLRPDEPTPTRRPPKPTEAPLAGQPAFAAAYETLRIMTEGLVPVNDPVDLAERLKGVKNIPETVPAPKAYKVGDKEKFWVSNVDTNENFQVDVVLRYAGPVLYFWVEDGKKVDQKALDALCKTFEESIYPTDREFFGSEWTPGIDNDPHLYVVMAGNLGVSLAGYFSSADSVHPLAHEYSNAHEMFVLNLDNVDVSDSYTYGTLAHEFQHMIHNYRDRNETSWLNEGFSMLAELLNGYDTGGFDYYYAMDTDMQLTDWLPDVGENGPHYGASFLFVTYFLDRFGEEATKALVAHPENSMTSVDAVLAELGVKDPETGKAITADDVFVDWSIANLLQDDTVGDGRYHYGNYANAPQAYVTETLADCPSGSQERTVNQYGVDSIEIACSGDLTVNFSGVTETGLLPVDPNSGDYAFWSNKGDESDMTLTREFDLTGVSGKATFTYNTWYDLEEDYDYLYLEASLDGSTWEILDTPSCTSEDPSGNSYGCGFNAKSGGWIEESVDLSRFAGKKVQLRFEYVTDAAVNGEGLMLDDVSIPEINYSSDFESDDGGWVGAGFVRVQNVLPQTYRVTLLVRSSSGDKVIPVELDDLQTGSLNFKLASGESAYLIVSGTTRFTRQLAEYQFSVDETR
ncbi:MAG TPA: immune inhibitor A [Anaerolineaceae bacterium]|nr:immune inhibitor A [Anaerolineaceae bacterium]HPN53635.1 immune inhibitor A [Anaerolineaceae bacterium]